MATGPAPADTLVWVADTDRLADAVFDRYAAWLGPSERQRAGRFVRPARRRQFIAGRALLRLALSHLVGLAPRDIRLQERPGAAPLLDLPGGLAAGHSISHSGSWVGCAVSTLGRVGFDIELLDPSRDIEALAGQAFDDEQRAWLAARPAQSRLRDFYTAWSTLEARFKLGTTPVASFEFFHADLSIVLCCERVHATAPMLERVSLSP